MPPKAKEPSALKPLHLLGVILLLAVAIASFVVGIKGIQILLDESASSPLSQTAFAHHYRKLIAMNPFFSAFFFNGGMIGALFCITKLVDHRKATRAAKQAPATGKEKAALPGPTETKKDK